MPHLSRDKDHAPHPGASKALRSLALLTSPHFNLPCCVLGSRSAKLFEPTVLRAATWLCCLSPIPFKALSPDLSCRTKGSDVQSA